MEFVNVFITTNNIVKNQNMSRKSYETTESIQSPSAAAGYCHHNHHHTILIIGF